MKGSPGKAPAFQFYVKDWLSDPKLRLTSPSTRGIWIDLLCFMWASNNKGLLELTREQIGKLTGANNSEIECFFNEAEKINFCDISVTNNGLSQICNRRMYREQKLREYNRLRQQKHREKKACNANVNQQKGESPTPSPSPTAKNKHNNKLLCLLIVNSFNEILPELNPVIMENSNIKSEIIKKQLLARIKSKKEYQDSEWWQNFFRSIRKMPWLMGETKNSEWMATFSWITKKINFNKILDGNYLEKGDEKWTNYSH